MLKSNARLEWFVSFLAVVDTGSFSAAAEATHRSQPRVSTHVAALEREVGLPLFDRGTRPATLTGPGKIFADHARTILRDLDAANLAMASYRNEARGLVSLGSYPSASAAFVPNLLRGFTSTNADVKVVLIERSTLELDDSFAAGELDLYLRPMNPEPGYDSVSCQPLWSEGLVVVHPSAHPLAEIPEPVELAEMMRYPLITIGRLDDPELGFETNELLRASEFEPELVQATNQPQTLIALTRAGMGIGLTNALAASVSDTTGVVVRPLKTDYRRHVGVYWDGSREMSTAAQALLTAVVAQDPPPHCRSLQTREASNLR